MKFIVKLGSRPCLGQVQMTTRSPQTQPLSQVTRSGPRADSIIAMPPPPPPPTHKTFLSEIRLKSPDEEDYKHSGKF